MKRRVRDGSFDSRTAVVSGRRERCEENRIERADGMSTGSAQEMQKGSGQWPVASGQFLWTIAELEPEYEVRTKLQPLSVEGDIQEQP